MSEVSFQISAGEMAGLVGETGSGKSTVGLALLGHARAGARIVAGSVTVNGQDVRSLTGEKLRRFRGRTASYVPQDPAAALNPALPLRIQLRELLDVHYPEMPAGDARARIADVLAEVQLPSDTRYLQRYPHELSGGQQQRMCLAMAFLLRPRLIVFDEPTTALDVTTQAHIIETIRAMCERHDVTGLYVSHDLSVVATLVQRVMVMYAGHIVEAGSVTDIFERPMHPYTRRLVACVPDAHRRVPLAGIAGHPPAVGARSNGCKFAQRCLLAVDACTAQEPAATYVSADHFARCIRITEPDGHASRREPSVMPLRDAAELGDLVLSAVGVSASYGRVQVLDDVSLALYRNECLALVGESGSGKTTLARTLVGLHPAGEGRVVLEHRVLERRARERSLDLRRRLQYIFQSPYASLNPRRTVSDIISVPLGLFFGLKGSRARERVGEALERVSLPNSMAERYPPELSGGERQRVAIARALAAEPSVLICDEITSALDVSVQASILELLQSLQDETDLSMLFVTHDFGVVRAVADRVLVLRDGHIIESGTTERVLDSPKNAYTRQLVADTPTIVRSVDVV